MSTPFPAPPRSSAQDASAPDASGGRLDPRAMFALGAAAAGLLAYVLGFVDTSVASLITGLPGLCLIGAGVLAGTSVLPRTPNTLVAAVPAAAYAALALLQAAIVGMPGPSGTRSVGALVIVVLLLALVQLGTSVGALLIDAGIVADSFGSRSARANSGRTDFPRTDLRSSGPHPAQPQSGGFPAAPGQPQQAAPFGPGPHVQSQPPQPGQPQPGYPQQPGGWNPGSGPQAAQSYPQVQPQPPQAPHPQPGQPQRPAQPGDWNPQSGGFANPPESPPQAQPYVGQPPRAASSGAPSAPPWETPETPDQQTGPQGTQHMPHPGEQRNRDT